MSVHLFHSFSNYGSTDKWTERGLKTLDSMAQMGLLITPHNNETDLEWREDRSGGRLGPPFRIAQKRLCFTAIDPTNSSWIKQHAKSFGQFSIELKPETALAMGVLPAVYMPTVSTQKKGLSNMASGLIARLHDAREVLESISRSNPNLAVTSSGAKVQDIANSLNAITSLISPTEKPFSERLTYFQQNEWRLVGNTPSGGKGKPIINDLNEDEKTQLRKLSSYFRKNVSMRGGSFRLVDMCKVLRAYDTKHPFESAVAIHVPRGTIRQAKRILSKHGLENVKVVSP